jgi:hypothetical protein
VELGIISFEDTKMLKEVEVSVAPRDTEKICPRKKSFQREDKRCISRRICCRCSFRITLLWKSDNQEMFFTNDAMLKFGLTEASGSQLTIALKFCNNAAGSVESM